MTLLFLFLFFFFLNLRSGNVVFLSAGLQMLAKYRKYVGSGNVGCLIGPIAVAIRRMQIKILCSLSLCSLFMDKD